MSNILVTGGAGFIGSNLCLRLLKQGHEVICVDNFYSGRHHNLRIIPQKYQRRLEVIRHDITFPLYIEVDQIYNLACPASPVYYQKDPVATTKTCVHGMINMLGLAKRCGARILQASTSEIYGSPEICPQKEAYWGHVNPIGPRSCYDEGKRCAETLCYNYRKQHNVDVRVIRIFNTYGPGMRSDDGRVVSNFIMAALKNQYLTVYGNGTQTRSFLYIDDLIEALLRSMLIRQFPGPINIGNPVETTMLDLAKLIIHKCQSKSWWCSAPLPTDDPPRRWPDISLANQVLGWRPSINLDEGLHRTIEWFRKGL